MMPKYQQGGNVYSSFFRVFKPILPPEQPRQAPSSRRTSDREENEKGKLTEKDLFTLFKDIKGALPNDSDALFNRFNNILQQARDFGQDEIGDISAMYMSVLQQLPHLQSSKEAFTNTYQRAVQNNSLNDIAITTSGHVVATDLKTGKMITLTPEQWANREQGQYEPVTNGNLLWLRRESPQYTGRDDIFQIVQNGISLEGVHKMIKDRLDLGKVSQSSNSFTSKESIIGIDGSQLSADQKKGLEALQAIVAYGPDGYYKRSQESSGATQEQIASAINYIYQTLPNNAKVRLAIEGDGTRKTIDATILALITGKMDTSIKDSYSYIGVKGGKGENGQDIGAIGDGRDMTTAERWKDGAGEIETITFNMGNNNYVTVTGNTMALTDGSGNKNLKVGTTTLGDVSEGSYGSALDFNNISIGGVRAEGLASDYIVLADNKVTMVDYPCINNNGKISPRISKESQKAKDEADEKIKQSGIDLNDPNSIKQNYETINSIYEEYGLPPKYTSNGDIDNRYWATFGVVKVATSKNLIEGLPNGITQKLDPSTSAVVLATLKAKDKNNKLDLGKDIYTGLAWIPVKSSSSLATSTSKVKASENQNLVKMDQARQTQQSWNSGGFVE